MFPCVFGTVVPGLTVDAGRPKIVETPPDPETLPAAGYPACDPAFSAPGVIVRTVGLEEADVAGVVPDPGCIGLPVTFVCCVG